MRKVIAVISALFLSGTVGGLYGAALGAVYALLVSISGALRAADAELLVMMLPLTIALGAMFGFYAGFISGVLGGSLGGPVGYAIGGFAGTGITIGLFSGGATSGTLFTLCPSIWGGAVGLVLGVHIRSRVQVLPGVGWLVETIYDCALGGWLGWRQRASEERTGVPPRSGEIDAGRGLD